MFLQFFNPSNAGTPGSGYKLFTYIAGTSTKQSTWIDSTQTIQNANPIILDANGVAAGSASSGVWGDPTLNYKFVWAPANDTDPPTSPIRSIDNITFPITLSLITQTFIGNLLFPETPAEITTGSTPVNFNVPSHAVTGEVYPARYGAKFDGATNDTVALQKSFSVAQLSGGAIVLPAGTAMVSNLLFGSNSGVGQSLAPQDMRGQGLPTIFKAIPGTTGTLLKANGLAATVFRDFHIDCNYTCSVGLDTSWPGTPGASAQNVYENIVIDHPITNGWLALNDNQSRFKDILIRGCATSFVITGLSGTFIVGEVLTGGTSGATARFQYYNGSTTTVAADSLTGIFINGETITGAASGATATATTSTNGQGLSGFRMEGSGGAIFLDNITVNNCFLSITSQNAQIVAGFFFGIRFNESQSSTNFTTIVGGTQIFTNPITLTMFEDANFATRSVGSLKANGIYLLGPSVAGTSSIINLGVGGKFSFEECYCNNAGGGTWNLYGAHATNSSTPNPSIVQFDGCQTGQITFNSVTNFVTQRRDVNNASAVALTDFPLRVVYRATVNYPSGLLANTWSSIVPASAVAESGACYLVSVYIQNTGSDVDVVQALMQQVSKTGAGVTASAAISTSTTANTNNSPPAISLRYSAATLVGSTYFSGFEFEDANALNNNSIVFVIVQRVCNPTINF
jgi:hypothetical protein